VAVPQRRRSTPMSMQGDQHIATTASVLGLNRHAVTQRLEQPPPPHRGHAVATASTGLGGNHDLDSLTSHVTA